MSIRPAFRRSHHPKSCLLALLLLWVHAVAAQNIDLSSTSPALPSDADPNIKFVQRATIVTDYNAGFSPLVHNNPCGKPDLGEAYHPKLFARFEYSILHPGQPNPGLQEAIDSLRNIQRGDQGDMGTDTSLECNQDFGGTLLGLLQTTFTDKVRKGDYDTLMNPLVTVLYRYGKRGAMYGGKNLLPADVYSHVLSLIDLSPGIGGVETLSFGANPLTTCPLVCAATANPFVCAGCLAVVATLRITAPETENHINNIYVAQYLANQLQFDETHDPKYDNSRNGYRTALLNRMKNFVRNDFVEYNSHPYQDYTMTALLNLYSFADDPAVKSAAKMILDYVSAKVAVSSNDARRSTPFRRRNEDGHKCPDLLVGCPDPQTPFYMMLAGVTDFLGALPQPAPGLDPNFAPGNYSLEFQWAAVNNYRIDKTILDLFVNRAHRNFYQFFHYTNTGSNDELYFGSPSFLLSAGGHPTQYAYTADIPFPLSLIKDHVGQDSDLGIPVPTTLMPTGAFFSRDQMIRFSEPNDNMCVAPNFACGLNPVLGTGYNEQPEPGGSPWTFINRGGPTGSYGYYVALFRQDNFGFFEVYDTYKNAKGYPVDPAMGFAAFKQNVLDNSQGKTYSGSAPNNYTTVDGTVIQFMADAKILTINGNPPYDPNRTNGTIINADGQGTTTITNPALGQSLTLDATLPDGHPQITVPGPVTFPDTCIGAKSFATLNVCNGGNGADNLLVYNILSQNTQMQVNEPSSGYPTAIGANFCFPFQAQFTPTVVGATSNLFTLSNSDPIVPFLNVQANGNGIQQGIATVIANSGDFGNVCAGAFADLNLTINNTGGCDLVISNIASSSADFKVAATLSYPLIIHAGASLSVPIRFQPSTFGTKTGDITVSSNDPKAPSQVVAVKGNVPSPVINASIANSGAFGNVCSGTQSDLTLQILNQGACSLTVSGIDTVGNPSFKLGSVTNFPLLIGGNSSVNVPIRFQPVAYGSPGYQACSNTTPQTANIVIHSNDPAYPDPTGFVRPVNAIEGCPTLTLSPHDLTGAFAFPATVSDPAGNLGCYTDRQITVGNAGVCPLHVAGLTAAPSNTFNVIGPSVPLTVAPGAAPVPVTIRFKPTTLTGQSATAPDQATGTLSIVSDDPVAADNGAGLCGEPAYHSGVRVLVVNAAGQPINPLKSLALTSKGLHPNVSQTLSPAIPVTAANICGNSITYTLDNENLPPAGTTGNNPQASYSLSAKQNSTQANQSFTLGQCELKSIIMQIK